MPNEVILHIGMHKTGSTSIQNALQGYDDERIRFAQLMHANHSYTIRTIFGATPEKDQFHAKHARSITDVRQIRQEMLQALTSELELAREKLIISGEGISVLPESSILNIKGFLLEYAPSVKVIAYVREPVGFTSSWFQQRVWDGIIRQPVIQKIGYRNRFEKFIDVFGADAVNFVKYDPNTFNHGSVVSDFCDRTRIDFGSVPSLTSNPRRSQDVIKLMYLLDQHRDLGDRNRNAHVARTKLKRYLRSRFEGKGFRIPDDIVFAALDFEDLRWMEKTANFSLIEPRQHNTILEKRCHQSALAAFLEELDPSASKNLECCLKNHEIAFQPGAPAADLILKLFGRFTEGRNLPKPAKKMRAGRKLKRAIRRLRRS